MKNKITQFVNRFISTPLWAYLIIAICLLIFLVCYFRDFHKDFSKNMFYAVIGSLIVSLLIDIGNTVRMERIAIENKKKAKKLLAPDIQRIYDCLGEMVAFVDNIIILSKNAEVRNGYNIAFKGYKDGCVYYRNNVKNEQGYYELKSFAKKFGKRLQDNINILRGRDMYKYLDVSLLDLINKMCMEGFYGINSLGLEFTPNTIFMAIDDEFNLLRQFVEEMKAFIDEPSAHKVTPLTDEEIDGYLSSNKAVFEQLKRDHPEEFEFIEKMEKEGDLVT